MPLSPELLENILNRLGLEERPSHDLLGLNELYSAWCHHIPFDNVRKMIALFMGGDEDLPGSTSDNFFKAFLKCGTGGTCWPTSNALFELIDACGFDARRISGAMLELPDINHGSVVVRLGDKEWLADSSILTTTVLPLEPESVFFHDHPVFRVEVDPVDSGFYVWFEAIPTLMMIPCKLASLETVTLLEYRSKYEDSREFSPFNSRLYIRRNFPDRIVSIVGTVFAEKTPDSFSKRELTRDEFVPSLVDDFGISPEIADTWATSGALDSTVETGDVFRDMPPFSRQPPSDKP